jgi:hypothetical protein
MANPYDQIANYVMTVAGAIILAGISAWLWYTFEF